MISASGENLACHLSDYFFFPYITKGFTAWVREQNHYELFKTSKDVMQVIVLRIKIKEGKLEEALPSIGLHEWTHACKDKKQG